MRYATLWLLGSIIVLPDSAMASLGGGGPSIYTDQTRMAASQHLITQSGDHAMHALTGRNGATIHEYVNTDGTVYAVSWQGPGKPDLAHLLGGYFQRFQDKGTRRARPHMRAPVQVADPDLVVRTGGHPGAFWGLAWLPAKAPAGFDPSTLQ